MTNMKRILHILGATVLLLIVPFILRGEKQPQFEVVAISRRDLTPDVTLG